MTEPVEGGRRRVDVVLHESFLDGLGELPLQEIRRRRHEAEQEDADLSYIRRLLQGRLDLLRAERARRAAATGSDPIVDHLPELLSDGARPSPRGLGRYLTVEPSRVAENRRRVEQMIADPRLSDATGLGDAELAAAHAELSEYEQTVSEVRRRVQAVMDTLTAEVTRRYRDGEASVDELLRAED